MRMLFLFHGLFHKTKLSLVFQCSVILLQLADLCRGQSWGVGSSQTVVALVGDDVTLPCHLEPAVDVYFKSVEWSRPDLDPRFVHVWYEGRNLLVNQNPSYKGRTSVSTEKLRRGDLSLSLSAVKHSDNGKYRCYFPPLSKETNVRLIVGSVSSALITGVKLNNSVLDVQCKSEGWYPEPEVLWLNSEGNLLSAGPAETLKGPDGLFTVSRRLTVEKTNRDRFVCRVQQNSINQIRDTHIQMSGLTLLDECSSSSASHISITLVVISICALAVFFIVWKYNQNKKGTMMKLQRENEALRQKEKLMANMEQKEDTEETKNEHKEQLMANVTHRGQQEDTEETKKEHEEQLQRDEKRKREFEKVVEALRTQTQDLKKVTENLKKEAKEMERKKRETEEHVESVERETIRDRAKGFIELKEIIFKDGANRRKMNLEQLGLYIEKLHIRADNILKEINIEALDDQGNISVREDKIH